MKAVYVLSLLLSLVYVVPAAPEQGLQAVTQVYPAGVMVQAAAFVVANEKHSWASRAGYNATDRRDDGEHADEAGDGPGLTVAYRRDFGGDRLGWFAGGRVDLWFMKIDWEDPGREGETDIVVLQPTLEVGHTFMLGNQWRCSPFMALGVEMNIDTEGEKVGEGAILLGGLAIERSF